MGLLDVADLEWEQLLAIHKHAVKFYEADKSLDLGMSGAPAGPPQPDRRGYTAKELQQLKEAGIDF